jgi:hypothetical protein
VSQQGIKYIKAVCLDRIRSNLGSGLSIQRSVRKFPQNLCRNIEASNRNIHGVWFLGWPDVPR